MTSERSLCGVLPGELETWAREAKEPAYRVEQILSWVHNRSQLDPEKMTNLPARLRERLALDFLPSPARVAQSVTSKDGTRKLRLEMSSGGAIETVLIPDESKLTQCLSTQIGCAFRCRFCLSGANGLDRNLRSEEILAQVHLAKPSYLEGERLSNIVLMGSGEPLANYGETARVITLLTSSKTLDLSTRRVTVSTIGLPRGIQRLGKDFGGRIGLAVSLHGPDDETRAKLLPRIRTVPIDKVLAALRSYPLPPRRRITIEYVLVRGVNDSPSHAQRLIKVLRRLRVKVNLIPFNPHHESGDSPPDDGELELFQQILIEGGLTAIVRRQRGADIGAACGQLVASGSTAE